MISFVPPLTQGQQSSRSAALSDRSGGALAMAAAMTASISADVGGRDGESARSARPSGLMTFN